MTAVLIVAHAPLASALKSVAAHAFPDCPHAVEALDVQPGDTAEAVRQAARTVLSAGAEREWLLLTDVFGATPSNAVQPLAEIGRVRVLAGVNVPMLWRALCYANEPPDLLAQRAADGAAQGLVHTGPTRPQNQNNPALRRDPSNPEHQQ